MNSILKYALYTALAVFSFTIQAYSQDCDFSSPSLILSTQDDVNNFAINHPNCTELDANIFIWEFNAGEITDLSPLSQLTRINGYIIIRDNEALTSLNGLHNLEQLTGKLEVYDNPALENIILNELDTIGEIDIYQSAGLTTIEMNKLEIVDGHMSIISSPNVESFTSFSNLKRVEGSLTLQSFNVLTSYEGFENLNHIDNQLYLGNNSSITDLTGFSGLDYIRNFQLINHAALISLDGFSSTVFIDAVRIKGNPLLTNCVIDPVCEALKLGNSDGFFGISDNGGAQCESNNQVLSDCEGIYGVPIQVFADNNQNAQFDAADSLLSGFLIELVGQGKRAFSSVQNPDLFYLEEGNYEVRFVDENYPNWQLTTSNPIISFTQPTYGIQDTILFGIMPMTANSNLITYMREVPALCDQNITLELTAHNFGTTTNTGTIWVKLDEQISDFVFTNTPDEMPTEHLIGWNFSDLKPNETFRQTMELQVPASPNDVYGGAIFNEVYAIYDDENGNHTSPSYHYTPLIECDFEESASRISPNQPSDLTPNYVLPDEYIFYTIDFENTTSEIIKDVVVEQTLDANFDWNSLKILTTNYPQFLQTHLSDDGNLKFLFKNIFIENNGDERFGMIQFAIKPKPNLVDSTLLNLNTTVKFGDFGSVNFFADEAVFINAYPSNCLYGTTWIDRQTRIDLFPFEYPYCKVISGTLDVRDGFAFPINNFDGFAQIDSIYGDLLVKKNKELLNFNGLNNLKYLGGELVIDENEVFENLEGLGTIEIKGDIAITDNPELKNLEGIQALGAVEKNLIIEQSPKLESIGALAGLSEIGGRLGLQGCLILENLNGLENFSMLGGFSMTYCPMVSDISALSNIQSLPISGLFLKFNQSLPNLNAFSNLTLTELLWLENNDLLTDLEGLNSLEIVDGRIFMKGNDALVSLDGLNNMTTVTGDFQFNETLLSDLTALSSLTNIGGNLVMQSPALESLEGLDNLEQIGGLLSVSFNPNLSLCSVEGICNHLQNGGDANISGNANGCGSVAEVLDNCDGIYKVNSRIFYDENQNGIREAGERALSNIAMEISPIDQLLISTQAPLNASYLDPGNYTFSVLSSNNPLWDVTTPAETFDIEIIDVDYPDTLEFGLYPNSIVNEMKSVITSPAMRCDQEVILTVTAQNSGTTIVENGTLELLLDASILGTSFIDFPDEILNDFQVVWNFEDLYPGESISRQIQIQLPGVMVIDVGEKMLFSSKLNFEDAFGSHLAPSFDYEPEFVCAYDPNDKLVNPDRDNDFIFQGENLVYTIRFQNTGNAPAFDVVLRDTLDESLDVRTFRFLESSHTDVLTTTLDDDRYLTFNFNNIFLPDSLSDPLGSQGYVTYFISPKEDIPLQTEIQNTASIYFDSNPPIVTNTTNSIKEEPSNTSNLVQLNHTIYPIPAQEEVIIQLEKSIPNDMQLRFFDASGRIYFPDYQLEDSKIRVDLSLFFEGVWIYSAIINEELIQGKMMILR